MGLNWFGMTVRLGRREMKHGVGLSGAGPEWNEVGLELGQGAGKKRGEAGPG